MDSLEEFDGQLAKVYGQYSEDEGTNSSAKKLLSNVGIF
jgi:hypothetical protein